jgi:hypothetical protein
MRYFMRVAFEKLIRRFTRRPLIVRCATTCLIANIMILSACQSLNNKHISKQSSEPQYLSQHNLTPSLTFNSVMINDELLEKTKNPIFASPLCRPISQDITHVIETAPLNTLPANILSALNYNISPHPLNADNRLSNESIIITPYLISAKGQTCRASIIQASWHGIKQNLELSETATNTPNNNFEITTPFTNSKNNDDGILKYGEITLQWEWALSKTGNNEPLIIFTTTGNAASEKAFPQAAQSLFTLAYEDALFKLATNTEFQNYILNYNQN